LALLLAAFGAGGGLAGADTPGTTVSVNPSTNLNATQNVSVSGAGFGANQPGTIRLRMTIGSTLDFSNNVGTFNTDSSGAFGPVTVTVTRTFTDIGGQQVTCSASQPCEVLASTDQTEQDAAQAITFATPTPTDVCAQLRAQQATVNAQITALQNSIPANLPPAQRTAVINQLNAVRAQANASFAAALAKAGCPV
jgi:hypothetical protein